MKTITTEQARKSTSLFSTEYLIDLEERFEKWSSNHSKKVVDDLFDGLKVCLQYKKTDQCIFSLQVFLGQFPPTLRMRMQKILDSGCAVR